MGGARDARWILGVLLVMLVVGPVAVAEEATADARMGSRGSRPTDDQEAAAVSARVASPPTVLPESAAGAGIRVRGQSAGRLADAAVQVSRQVFPRDGSEVKEGEVWGSGQHTIGPPLRAPRDPVNEGEVWGSGRHPSFRSLGGNAALARLRNPFDFDPGAANRGWLGRRVSGGGENWGGGPSKAVPFSRDVKGMPVPDEGGMRPGEFAGPGAGLAAPGSPLAPEPPGAAPPGSEAFGAAPPGSEAFGAAPPGSEAFGAAVGAAGPGFGGGLGAASEAFPMIGDMSPYRLRGAQSVNLPPPSVTPPPVPGPRSAALFYPTVRNFKISENMSPRPQDRLFYNFHYYNDLNGPINTFDRTPINNFQAFRHLFGLEKTFNAGKGSLGLRFPIDTLTADSLVEGLQTPTRTAVGNLTVFGKYVLEQNPETGSLASVGLAITAPTGPGRFASAPYVFGLNTTTFQPFFGYIYNLNNWFFQGFSAFDFPANPRDVTLLFNDFAIGYFLLRSEDPGRFVTAIAPTFEVHVNTPLNHRNWKDRFDIAAAPDVVNLTYGINVQFRRTAVLTTALITPVSSPKPFEAELAVLLNVFYGRTRASRIPITPPL